MYPGRDRGSKVIEKFQLFAETGCPECPENYTIVVACHRRDVIDLVYGPRQSAAVIGKAILDLNPCTHIIQHDPEIDFACYGLHVAFDLSGIGQRVFDCLLRKFFSFAPKDVQNLPTTAVPAAKAAETLAPTC
jgi:hypothetical protein